MSEVSLPNLTSLAASPSVYVGRHPIYDRNLDVVAYELLYRSGDMNFAEILDGNRATFEVLTAAFVNIGIEKIVGHKKAFVNLTREFLIGDYLLPLQRDRVVLEILEDVTVDDEVIAAMRRLRDEGFTLALDDFILSNNQLPLVELAHLVKIDIAALTREELIEHVQVLKRHDVRLLAEKVETVDEYNACTELGFDYFQGYFFCKPNIISGDREPENQTAVLRLLAELHRSDVEMPRLVELISQDVTISYRLLRFINSAYFAFRVKIGSIQQAAVQLGFDPLRKWVTMIALGSSSSALPEVTVMALIRAKMCESLAELDGRSSDLSSYFTVGLFSMLDQLVGRPIRDILDQLPLAEDVQLALLENRGRRGELLQSVIDYEAQRCETGVSFGFTREQLIRSYVDAVAWADGIVASLGLFNNANPIKQ